MAAHRILIGEGASQVILAGPKMTYDFSSRKQVNEAGAIEAIDWIVTVEMDVIGDGASDIYGSVVALNAEVVSEIEEKRVQLQLDGVTQIDLDPANGFIGPHVSDFQTISEPGAGESHWRVRLVIFFKEVGGGGSTTYDLSTSITVVKNPQGKVVRKIWRANASARTVAEALARIRPFKPSGSNISEALEKTYHPKPAASAVWEWEYVKASVRLWHCRVQYGPGGRYGYVADKQVGELADPNLFLTRRDATRITVTGTIITTDPAVVPPSPHFSEGRSLFRANADEPYFDVEIEDEVKGLYRLEYQEHWISSSYPPSANHSDAHNLINPDSESGDGSIAG